MCVYLLQERLYRCFILMKKCIYFGYVSHGCLRVMGGCVARVHVHPGCMQERWGCIGDGTVYDQVEDVSIE